MMEELALFLGGDSDAGDGKGKKKPGLKNIPVILTGDLNSIPTNNVYTLLSTSKLKHVEFGSKVRIFTPKTKL